MFSKRFIKALENDFAVTKIDIHSFFVCDDMTEYLIEMYHNYIQVTDLSSDVTIDFEYEKEVLDYLEAA